MAAVAAKEKKPGSPGIPQAALALTRMPCCRFGAEHGALDLMAASRCAAMQRVAVGLMMPLLRACMYAACMVPLTLFSPVAATVTKVAQRQPAARSTQQRNKKGAGHSRAGD